MVAKQFSCESSDTQCHSNKLIFKHFTRDMFGVNVVIFLQRNAKYATVLGAKKFSANVLYSVRSL